MSEHFYDQVCKILGFSIEPGVGPEGDQILKEIVRLHNLARPHPPVPGLNSTIAELQEARRQWAIPVAEPSFTSRPAVRVAMFKLLGAAATGEDGQANDLTQGEANEVERLLLAAGWTASKGYLREYWFVKVSPAPGLGAQ